MRRGADPVPSLLSLLGLGAAGYLLLLGYMFLAQNSLLFLPGVGGRQLAADPGRIGLRYEDVWLHTDDGERLHAWYLPAPGADYTLLFLHGNAGKISHRLDSLALFHQLGLNQLILDYRGYGQSDGAPSGISNRGGADCRDSGPAVKACLAAAEKGGPP